MANKGRDLSPTEDKRVDELHKKYADFIYEGKENPFDRTPPDGVENLNNWRLIKEVIEIGKRIKNL